MIDFKGGIKMNKNKVKKDIVINVLERAIEIDKRILVAEEKAKKQEKKLEELLKKIEEVKKTNRQD